MRTTRRFSAQLAITLGFVLVLASCGTNDDVGTTDPSPEDGTEAAADATDENGGLVIDGEQIADAELWDAAQEEGHILLYSANPEAAWAPVFETFTEDTGITVEVVRLVSAQLHERILSELAVGEGPDAIYIGENTIVDSLIEEEVFDPHTIPNRDEISEELLHPEDYVVTGIRNQMVPAYNTELVDEADVPTTWEDLLDSRWQNDIGITYIGVGGSAFTVAMLQRELYGEEYWEQLAAQDPSILESVVPLTEEIVRGEVSLGVTSPAVVYGQMESGAPIDIVFPEDGVPAFPFFLGVANTAENPNAARVLMNWQMSQRGSQVALEITGEVPSHPDVEPVTKAGVEIDPAGAERFIPTDEHWAQRDEFVERWNNVFGYTD